MAANDDAIKTCVNPVWRLLASEGGNRPKFDMAKQEDHHPRYTTTPSSSAAPCDVDSRSQRFAAAARQVGSTTPQISRARSRARIEGDANGSGSREEASSSGWLRRWRRWWHWGRRLSARRINDARRSGARELARTCSSGSSGRRTRRLGGSSPGGREWSRGISTHARLKTLVGWWLLSLGWWILRLTCRTGKEDQS